MNLRDFTSPEARRIALEKKLAVNLKNIGSSALSTSPAQERNCENMIGYAQIPVGIAGPLKIKGSSESKDYYLPLATTEGALVASISRGAKAITLSGGAVSSAYKLGVTRGPVFYTESIPKSKVFFEWINNNSKKIKEHAEKTSSHLKLKKIDIKGLAGYSFVRFSFDTTDAMGMNMATIASEEAVKLIEKETGVKCITTAGNYDIDKKPAFLNTIKGRGIEAWSEVVLSSDVVHDVLKTTPEKFFETWLAKVMLGSAMAGSLGFNAHMANVIAAIFLATGQDAAHVVEGSLGITTAKVLPNGDLYVGVFMPSLMLGTVGGGTGLATQREALEMLGVAGEGRVIKFAEIVSASVLAGEISLLASLSEGSLAKAHQKLGRGKV